MFIIDPNTIMESKRPPMRTKLFVVTLFIEAPHDSNLTGDEVHEQLCHTIAEDRLLDNDDMGFQVTDISAVTEMNND